MLHQVIADLSHNARRSLEKWTGIQTGVVRLKTRTGDPPEAFLGNRVGQASRLPPGGEADGTSALPVAPERTRGRRDACPALGPIRFRVPMRERISADAFSDQEG